MFHVQYTSDSKVSPEHLPVNCTARLPFGAGAFLKTCYIQYTGDGRDSHYVKYNGVTKLYRSDRLFAYVHCKAPLYQPRSTRVFHYFQ